MEFQFHFCTRLGGLNMNSYGLLSLRVFSVYNFPKDSPLRNSYIPWCTLNLKMEWID